MKMRSITSRRLFCRGNVSRAALGTATSTTTATNAAAFVVMSVIADVVIPSIVIILWTDTFFDFRGDTVAATAPSDVTP